MLTKLNGKDFDKVFTILEESFPKDEYRTYEKQKALLDDARYTIYIIPDRDEVKAFIAVWQFDDFAFVEHFAVNQAYRNQGLGSIILQEVMKKLPCMICLEVELPETDFAKRRIGFYERNGIHVNERGRAVVNEETCETNLPGVYVAGDGLGGPATVVEGIRDGLKAAEAVIGGKLVKDFDPAADEKAIYEKRGNLLDQQEGSAESGRCLGCSGICENCTEVCPNRANISIRVPGMEKHQIIHVDYMCNECGNCRSFCPYDSAPYLDKFTLFADVKDMEDSSNQGFAVLDRETVRCRVRFFGETVEWTMGDETRIPEALQKLMETVCRDYSYLLRT